ncbi:hypothetical protein ABPG72_013028 [Tetrahymena utriculariae]
MNKAQHISGIFYKPKKQEKLVFVGQEDFVNKIEEDQVQGTWDLSQIEQFHVINYDFCKYLPYGCTAKELYLRPDISFNYENKVYLYSLILEGISHYSNLVHLQLHYNFNQYKHPEEYQFLKCIQKSFPQLESLDFKFLHISGLINNLFTRINQNIKKIILDIFPNGPFYLSQFSNFKNIQYFSLTVQSSSTKGFKYLNSILQTTKHFELNFQQVDSDVDIESLGQFIEKSEYLESVSIQIHKIISSQKNTLMKKLLDNIRYYPITLKEFQINENKVQEEIMGNYMYHSSNFLHSLQTLIPQLTVLKIKAKGFQYKLNNQDNVEELEFLKQLSNALSRQNNIKEIDLRFGGSLNASEETFRYFFSSLCIDGLQQLTLDLERWNYTQRQLTQQQDIHIVSFFLKALKENCSKTLTSLRINFDGWSIYDDCNMLIDELRDFNLIQNLILMGPKNRTLLKNYPLMVFEDQMKQKRKYLYLLQILKSYSLKNSMRVDYLFDIAFQYVQVQQPQICLIQENDPFIQNLCIEQISRSVQNDVNFRNYRKINYK